MNKFWAAILICLAIAAGVRFLVSRSSTRPSDVKPDILRNEANATPVFDRVSGGTTQGEASAEKGSEDSRSTADRQAHPKQRGRADPTRTASSDASPETHEAGSSSPAPAALKKILNGGGPSIGTVRVLGHRGCPSNTPGWFVSVGPTEQYEFTVSDDGETIEIEPNTQNLTGAFNFNHCADPGQFTGKRVRFSATIKAQGVTQMAIINLRGEDFRENRILLEKVTVAGTHDWKDYSVEAEVGPDVTLFSYGVAFRSPGKLWMSHPTFSIIP